MFCRSGTTRSHRICEVVFASALRMCANCQWPICTECWDDRNAVCGVCDWRLVDLQAYHQMTIRDSRFTWSPKSSQTGQVSWGSQFRFHEIVEFFLETAPCDADPAACGNVFW